MEKKSFEVLGRSRSPENKSFEVLDRSRSPKSKRHIVAGVVAGLVVFILLQIYRALTGSDPEPAPTPPAVAKPGVQVIAKDPAKQAEVNQQLEQLRYYIANPTMDDANITVQWLSQQYGQTPEVVVRDLLVMIERLEALSDDDLESFFASDQNPWREDQGYNAITKFITHREYLEFVKKCAILYQTQPKG